MQVMCAENVNEAESGVSIAVILNLPWFIHNTHEVLLEAYS